MANRNEERIIYCRNQRGYWTGARWGRKDEAKVFENWDAAKAEMIKAEIHHTVTYQKKI